jgi:hypothetical protein
VRKVQTLLDSPKYKNFIQDRDKALEQININAQTDISRIWFNAFEAITGFVSHMAIRKVLAVHQLAVISKYFEGFIEGEFDKIRPTLLARIERMRNATSTLTYISELEAIARATKKTKTTPKYYDSKDVPQGIDWLKRLWIISNSMKFKILQAFNKAIVAEKSPEEIVEAVKSTYPEVKQFKLPPRALKPLREADKKKEEEKLEFSFYNDFVSDADWNLAVDAYTSTELLRSRFDYSGAEYDPEAGYRRYGWELEQDLTDDFVQQVRDGQVEAANDLGVKEFIWVSIIDNKTCDECCLPRNGKTTSEIEEMLDNGGLNADECDAVTPPAHANCLSGSAIIDINYPILKIFRRRYSNTMPSIIMDDGSILNVTANHPILTQRGWQAAKEIKIGDYLISPLSQGSQAIKRNPQHMEATIEQIFDALSFITQITSSLQSTTDFHGDGIADEHVDIISVNRELILNGITKFLENKSDFLLKGANLSRFIPSQSNQNFFWDFSSSNSRMSFISECEKFLLIHSSHTQDISFTSIPGSNVVFDKPLSDSPSINSIFTSYSKFTHPILIILDRIFINWECPRLFSPMTPGDNLYSTSADVLTEVIGVMPNDLSSSSQSETGLVKFNCVKNIILSDFTEHVYNLETPTSWYIANNFIIHNCRCDIVPVASTDEVEGPNWKSFDEWLNS